MIDFQVAMDKLSSFQTSDELADYFREEGVMGVIGQTNDCPIARWMQDATEEVVHVSADDAFIYEVTEYASMYREHAFLSPAMETFVERFDDGGYPDMVLKVEEE